MKNLNFFLLIFSFSVILRLNAGSDEKDETTLSQQEPMTLSQQEQTTLSQQEQTTLSQEEPMTLSQEEQTTLSQQEQTTLSQQEQTTLSQEEPMTLSQQEQTALSQEEPMTLSQEEQTTLSQQEPMTLSQKEQTSNKDFSDAELLEELRILKLDGEYEDYNDEFGLNKEKEVTNEKKRKDKVPEAVIKKHKNEEGKQSARNDEDVVNEENKDMEIDAAKNPQNFVGNNAQKFSEDEEKLNINLAANLLPCFEIKHRFSLDPKSSSIFVNFFSEEALDEKSIRIFKNKIKLKNKDNFKKMEDDVLDKFANNYEGNFEKTKEEMENKFIELKKIAKESETKLKNSYMYYLFSRFCFLFRFQNASSKDFSNLFKEYKNQLEHYIMPLDRLDKNLNRYLRYSRLNTESKSCMKHSEEKILSNIKYWSEEVVKASVNKDESSNFFNLVQSIIQKLKK